MFVVCASCSRRHNPAHRCPNFRLDASQWVRSDVDAVLPPVPVHLLPAFDDVCPHCSARFWPGENINCCGRGRLVLPFGDDVPAELSDVILSAHVRQHIRR